MSVGNYGDYNTTETVNIPFNTFDSNDPTQSVTITDLVAADIEIHKDGAVAQRTSDNGVTVSINFDGITGNHMIHIDLSDNSDAGFYAAGSRYQVRIEGVTVDAGTLNSWVGFFSIGCVLRPTTDGRTLDVSSTGEAGLDFDNIKDATGAHTLTNITVPVVSVNSDMRGTDNAALASVLGALADAAADGDPTNAETVMQYVKQLINILVGTVGIPAFPAEAAPANNVSLSEVIRAIHSDVTGLNGAVMRGTDNAALAATALSTATWTAARAGYLDNVNGHTAQSADNNTILAHADYGNAQLVRSTTPANTLDVNVTGETGLDLDNTSGTILAAQIATDAIGAAQLAADAAVEIAAAVWDRILTGATHNIPTSAGRRLRGIQEFQGYEGGAIWIDTVNGTAGTVDYENGTVENPVDTITDANILAASLGIARFYVLPGSSITFVGAQQNQQFDGCNWTLALGGQDISGTTINCAKVTGIATGTSPAAFFDCEIGAVTLPPAVIKTCGIGRNDGLFTAGSTGEYVFHNCYSLVPGSGTPDFDFSGIGASVGVNNRAWTGGSNYTLDSDCTLSHEVLAGGGQTFVTGGADVEVRGLCRSLTFTLSGAGTVQSITHTGPITISGAATTTVNLHGISTSLTDTSSGTTVNDSTIKKSEVDEILADVTGLNGDAMRGTDSAALAATALSNVTWTDAKAGYLTGAVALEATLTAGLEAIINRGDAAWVTGGGVGGASTITFTIEESGSIPIPDAAVQIWNTGLTVLISYGTTDSNGQVQITADDGTYKVKVRKSGYSFSDPFDLTVSGNTSQTYTGTDYAPSAPSNPDMCRVYDYLYDAEGSPLSSAPRNEARIVLLPHDDGSIIYSNDPIEGTYNSDSGLIYWDLVQGATVNFVIHDFSINLTELVPSTSTARLSDIS